MIGNSPRADHAVKRRPEFSVETCTGVVSYQPGSLLPLLFPGICSTGSEPMRDLRGEGILVADELMIWYLTRMKISYCEAIEI